MRKRLISDTLYKQIVDTMPIPTVDILFFTPDKKKTLLCLRTNKPARNVYFSIGGRHHKNERLLDCAVRKVREELGLRLDARKFIFGGVQDEIFKDSVYPRVSTHAVNAFYGYVLDEKTRLTFDEQHSGHRWFSVREKKLHPLIKSKLKALMPKLP